MLWKREIPLCAPCLSCWRKLNPCKYYVCNCYQCIREENGDGGGGFIFTLKMKASVVLWKLTLYVDTDCACIPKVEHLCEMAWYMHLCWWFWLECFEAVLWALAWYWWLFVTWDWPVLPFWGILVSCQHLQLVPTVTCKLVTPTGH